MKKPGVAPTTPLAFALTLGNVSRFCIGKQVAGGKCLAVNRLDEGFRKQYQHPCHRKATGVAKVAAVRSFCATRADAD